MAPSFTQWQQRDYPASDAPFRQAEVNGPSPFYHDELDKLRLQWRQTPEATYPDGYLDTINTRRQDRLLQGLKQREQNRPYTRGIHKGEKQDPSDYFWPPEFNFWTGLQLEAMGQKFFPPGLGMEYTQTLANDGKNPDAWRMQQDDPDRVEHLKRLAPPWSNGPGMAVPYPGR
jgi:hypothetical protein